MTVDTVTCSKKPTITKTTEATEEQDPRVYRRVYSRVRDHSFSTYANISERLTFLTRARNVSFSEKIAYVLKE